MNEVVLLENEELRIVRIILINGEPWINENDIANVLGYSKSNNEININANNDDTTTAELRCEQSSQQMNDINEYEDILFVFALIPIIIFIILAIAVIRNVCGY